MKRKEMSRDEYFFVKKNKDNIKDIQMLADILEAINRGYFHYDQPITLHEIKEIASDRNNSHYRLFFINKRNGDKRQISAPDNRLKEIQNCIRLLLTSVNHRGKSIIDYAKPHVGKDVVYNMDIKDFYPSINATQIIPALLYKGYSYDVALTITSLVTMRSKTGTPVLPQGAPSSPVISEIVLKKLDAKLSKFSRRHNFQYSRYVDDITFSCSRTQKWWYFARTFREIIESEGFFINKKKNRVSFYYQRQEVAGLTVNSQLNVTNKYIKQLRTILHNWEKDGYVLASNKFLMHYYKNMTNAKDFIPKMEHIVAGKLSYLKMVRRNKRIRKSEIPHPFSSLFDDVFDNSSIQPEEDEYTIIKTSDPVWEKLHDRYVALRARDFNIINGHKNDLKLQKRVYRYGDDAGPLVYAVRNDDSEQWRIIKIYINGVWQNGDEEKAYRLRYGY